MFPKATLFVDPVIRDIPGFISGLNWSVGFNQSCFLLPEIVKFALFGMDYRPPEWIQKSDMAAFMDPQVVHMSGLFFKALMKTRRVECLVSLVKHPHTDKADQKVFRVEIRCFRKARELVWHERVYFELEGNVVLVQNLVL